MAFCRGWSLGRGDGAGRVVPGAGTCSAGAEVAPVVQHVARSGWAGQHLALHCLGRSLVARYAEPSDVHDLEPAGDELPAAA